MAQYLLAMHQPVGPAARPEVLEQIMARPRRRPAGDAGRRRLGLRRRAARAGEPRPCCAPRATRCSSTDGPYAEGKEHLGGFSVIDVARPRRRAGVGRQAGRGHARCRSRCGPSATRSDVTGDGRESRRSSASTTAARSPSSPASSATSTPPRRRSRTPSSTALCRGGRPTASRPARPAGSSRPPGTGPSTGCGGRAPAPTGTSQAALLHDDDAPARGGTRGATTGCGWSSPAATPRWPRRRRWR